MYNLVLHLNLYNVLSGAVSIWVVVKIFSRWPLYDNTRRTILDASFLINFHDRPTLNMANLDLVHVP